MARPGISYLDVAKAAAQLVEQNTNPTIEAVRHILGTGSSGTINRHLRVWREKQGNALEAQKGLPDSLLVAVKGIYDAIHEEASCKVNELKITFENQVNELNMRVDVVHSEKATVENENAHLKSNRDELEKQVAATDLLIADLNRKKENYIRELEFAQQSILDKKEELDRLSKQLTHSHENLDHYRDTIRQERENEKQEIKARAASFDNQLRQYQAKLLELEKVDAVKTNQITQLEATISVCQNKLMSLEQEKAKSENALSCYKVSTDSLKQTNEKLKAEQTNLQTELKNYQVKNQQLMIELEKIRERSKASELSLKKADSKCSELDHKYIHLLQEKMELAAHAKRVESAMNS